MSAPYSTDDAGIPMPHDGLSRSVGPNGPLLLQDHFLLQKMAHSNRERVPERVVRAKGGGVARGLGRPVLEAPASHVHPPRRRGTAR
ncbi:catalase [Nocardiopsis arvandica]|uniref:Catalase n=1 Tax=Nocardiopsis sinuspersici TaxID=501010 RepID=A0A7Y9XD56_9ACTN|nr:catalase [Nocardiopsis sinuspersici]